MNKHLVIITDAWKPQINGVVTTMANIVELLHRRGWKVTVVHPGLFKTRPIPGYEQIRITLNPWRLCTMLKHLQPTHVHISVEGPLGIVARILCGRWGWHYTTAYHTNFPQYFKSYIGLPETWIIPFIRWFHRNSAAVLVPSSMTAQKLSSWGIASTVIWSRGFDSTVFFPIKRSAAKQMTLLYVGRVSKEKNIEQFLQLQAADRHLIVVGDGPEKEKLQRDYPAVDFVGFKSGAQLAAYYQNADVFVFPSKSDTLGVVMIEAIACGTPVAAYPVEGPLDVVSQGINGALNENLEKAVELASAISRVIVAESSKKFSWEKSADTFEQQLVVI